MSARAALAAHSGRRARGLRILGRLIAVALVLWLIGLALAGLDVLPRYRFLLAHSLVHKRPPTLVAPHKPTHRGKRGGIN